MDIKINFVRFWRVVSTFTKGRDRGKQFFLRFYAGYHVFSIMFKIAWEVLFYSKRKVRTISCRMSLIGALCDKNSLLWIQLKFFDFCKFSKFEKFSKQFFFPKKSKNFQNFTENHNSEFLSHRANMRLIRQEIVRTLRLE